MVRYHQPPEHSHHRFAELIHFTVLQGTCSHKSITRLVQRSTTLQALHQRDDLLKTAMASLAAQKRTTQTVIDAYNSWDVDAIIAFRAPDCTQQILPLSMGRPETTNEKYRERMKVLAPHFKDFTVRTSIMLAPPRDC
jgi:hypothetical protein